MFAGGLGGVGVSRDRRLMTRLRVAILPLGSIVVGRLGSELQCSYPSPSGWKG
jgi:hypothetical protein